MTDKTLMAFLAGLATGGVLSILFAPMKGRDFRDILAQQHGNDDGGIHNFNIAELTSENSTSLTEIRKQFQD